MIREDVIEQSGIPGMQWYVRNGPPYPLDRKTHNRVVKKGNGKKTNFIKDMKEKSADKKKAKKRAENLAKARAARAEKAKKEAAEKKLEADKERVLKSGTATELAKYRGRLTNQELQNAWNRLELESRILSKAEAENVKPDKVKKFFDNLDTVTRYAKSGIDAYDTFADVYNAFAAPKNPVTKIRGGEKKKEEKKSNGNSVSKEEIEALFKKYQNKADNVKEKKGK